MKTTKPVRKSRTLPKALGNPYRVLISRADNGYGVQDTEGRQEVVAEVAHGLSDDNALAAHAFAGLVWMLADLFGVYGSKHDEARFRACVFPGSNHPDYETAECPVCGREPEKGSGQV